MSKLLSLNELLILKRSWSKSGKKVVWTNGCFDIMHAGHVNYLQQAKNFGDILVVGMNSDQSVRALKGTGRPICNERHRAQVLVALECVDFVIVFDEKSPVKIIEQFQPDVYVKGGDYTIDTIDQVERRVVEGYGGKIVLLPEEPGISTTLIIEKIQKIAPH
ncbi:D-glycero-beta-D-manno-heptose 1-phosphate adenylyltransferase [candidate division KSB1 bacterium 4484_87]|nr:MAG: D-glycero-beta-D-manno-heptose 1-phosphate adenylyltransferase [candidate division KSB1 bacterium 4484_87]